MDQENHMAFIMLGAAYQDSDKKEVIYSLNDTLSS
jgi:hypothetical protein